MLFTEHHHKVLNVGTDRYLYILLNEWKNQSIKSIKSVLLYFLREIFEDGKVIKGNQAWALSVKCSAWLTTLFLSAAPCTDAEKFGIQFFQYLSVETVKLSGHCTLRRFVSGNNVQFRRSKFQGNIYLTFFLLKCVVLYIQDNVSEHTTIRAVSL